MSFLYLIKKIVVIKCQGNDSALNPENGIAVCTTSDYSYQTTCMTRCDEGYSILEGQKTTECQSNKRWSHVLSACKGKMICRCYSFKDNRFVSLFL